MSLKPRLLLLDEIAAGLIPNEIEILKQLIQAIKSEGCTILIIEQVLKLLFEVSDEILVLNFGSLVGQAPPKEIAADPRVQEIYLGDESDVVVHPDCSNPEARSLKECRPPETLLKLENVSSGYGDFQALFDVSLEINKEEIISLIGVNGAGKTTAAPDHQPQLPLISGDISFDGRSMAKTHPSKVAGLGITQCMEGRRLFPEMTVRENIESARTTARPEKTVRKSWPRYSNYFRCCANVPTSRLRPCPAANSRWWPLPAPSWAGRA